MEFDTELEEKRIAKHFKHEGLTALEIYKELENEQEHHRNIILDIETQIKALMKKHSTDEVLFSYVYNNADFNECLKQVKEVIK